MLKFAKKSMLKIEIFVRITNEQPDQTGASAANLGFIVMGRRPMN